MATPAEPTTPLTPPTAPTAPLKPGAQTSEGWLTALSIALGALPAFLKALGVTYDISPLVQAVGLIISGLSGIHYTAQRSMLKRAYANTATNASKVTVTPALATAAAIIATIALLACGGTKASGTQIIDGAGSAASAGLQCEKVNLEQDVTINGTTLTLIEAVGSDLLSGNYAAAILDLIKTLGGQAVGCAMLAWQDFESTIDGNAGSAIATSIASPHQLALARANELIAKYGWKRAPKTSFRTHMTSANTADIGTGDMSSARKRAAAQTGSGN